MGEIDHVALVVGDVRRSLAWYEDVLGLGQRCAGQWEGVPTLVYSGRSGLALFPAAAVAGSPPAAGWTHHIAFTVDRLNFRRAQDHLTRQGVPWTFEDYGIAHSLHFTDPDGYRLELTTAASPAEADSVSG